MVEHSPANQSTPFKSDVELDCSAFLFRSLRRDRKRQIPVRDQPSGPAVLPANVSVVLSIFGCRRPGFTEAPRDFQWVFRVDLAGLNKVARDWLAGLVIDNGAFKCRHRRVFDCRLAFLCRFRVLSPDRLCRENRQDNGENSKSPFRSAEANHQILLMKFLFGTKIVVHDPEVYYESP